MGKEHVVKDADQGQHGGLYTLGKSSDQVSFLSTFLLAHSITVSSSLNFSEHRDSYQGLDLFQLFPADLKVVLNGQRTSKCISFLVTFNHYLEEEAPFQLA